MTALVWVVLLQAQTFPVHDGWSGTEVAWESMLDDLVLRDVVMLGEVHDSAPFHEVQVEVLRELHARRADVVLSLEMFERDVQGLVTDYVRGRIDEELFLERSRPWKRYADFYRPLVEYARDHDLDVLAANCPRRVSAHVARGGELHRSPYTARQVEAPRDEYWRRFLEAMGDHARDGARDAMTRMYQAQCLKDETMGESMADYLAAHAHRRPLVVHCGGYFHSDFGLGTAASLLRRSPRTRLGLVSCIPASEEDPFEAGAHRRRAHYLVLVPPTPDP